MTKEINIETINKLLRIDGKAVKALDVLSSQPREHLVMILTHIIDYLEEQREPEKECTCASFFTVRGGHKPDCPAFTEQKEEDWENKIIGIGEVSKKLNGNEVSRIILLVRNLLSKAKTDEREKIKGIVEKGIEILGDNVYVRDTVNAPHLVLQEIDK